MRVVCLLHDEGEATSRGGLCPSGARLACRPGPFPGSWALVGGTAEDAAVCGADPTSGLVASLGFACVACVVGVAREPCLGEDAAGARATRAGRRAAVTSGVPVVVATVPTTTAEAPVAGARDALERVLRVMRDNAVLPLVAPRNSPRSHFPFPTKDRWASLGTSAFPWPDAEMATRVAGDARDAGDFAAADCWSLGGGRARSERSRAAVVVLRAAEPALLSETKEGAKAATTRAPSSARARFRCAPRCARRSGTGTCSCA